MKYSIAQFAEGTLRRDAFIVHIENRTVIASTLISVSSLFWLLEN